MTRGKVKSYWLATVVALGFMLILVNMIPFVDLNGNTIEDSQVASPPEHREIADGTTHSPISITSDTNFNSTAVSEGWPGNGTSGNPFIIEGLDIDLGGAPGHAISISNTAVYFVIRDCSLTGASTSLGSGIYLAYVANGLLINNTCTGNDLGIYLQASFSVTIDNNSCTSNLYGIDLDSVSYSNTLIGNRCTNNSIGIIIEVYSEFNTLMRNVCTNNTDAGIYLTTTYSNTVEQNNCTYNSVNDIRTDPLCQSNKFQWNILENNCYSAGSSELFDYNFWSDYGGTDSNGDGFGDAPYIFDYNTDSHPLMFPPTYPRWTEMPENQVIEIGQVFTYDLNATAPAPILWSTNDTARFTVNSQGVIESIGTLYLGRYTIQVTVANLYGFSVSASFNLDVVLAPETKPPGWLISPTDMMIPYGEGVDLQIPAVDPSGIDRWTLNDTVHFSLSAVFYDLGSTARITNNSILDSGLYGLNLTVYDSFDNSLSATFVIRVLEVPTIVTTSTTSTLPVVEGMDPLLALGLGVVIGGASVIAIVAIFRIRHSWVQKASP